MLTTFSKLFPCRDLCMEKESQPEMHVVYYPHNRPWTWKPLHPADRQRFTLRARQVEMGEMKHSEAILRLLAQELLTEQECHMFKQSLHHFRVSHSVPSLCQQLKPVINSPEKFLLLVELSSRLPKSLQDDFHRLCALQYPNYETYLRLLNNGHSTNPKNVAQESLSRFKNFPRNSDKKIMMRYNNQKHTYELHSLPGTSVTSGVYSDTGDDDTDDDEDNDKVDISDVPANNGRVTPVHLKGKRNVHRVFLQRHDDGSLGLGITGGKEFCTEIVISVVEEGGPAATQGLKVGDRILEVNGHLFEEIMHAEAVTIMRNAWNLIMLVQSPEEDVFTFDHTDVADQSGPRLQEVELIVYPSSMGKLGCTTQRLHNKDLVVTTVTDNSPAEKGGVQVNDQVVKIDNICVADLSEKQIQMLTKSKRLNICVKRDIPEHIEEADLANQRHAFLTGLVSRRTSGGFPPEKLRRVHRSSESELLSNSGRDHSAESKHSSHYNKENTKPPSPRTPRRIYANRPEHYKKPRDVNWVLSPKSRENRYIRRRDMIVQQPQEQNHQVFSRSRSAEPHDIRNTVTDADTRQNFGAPRYVRNRSYSPHRSAIAVRQIQQEDNVIRAIQQGLEKRHRVIRHATYRMADPADYEWEI